MKASSPYARKSPKEERRRKSTTRVKSRGKDSRDESHSQTSFFRSEKETAAFVKLSTRVSGKPSAREMLEHQPKRIILRDRLQVDLPLLTKPATRSPTMARYRKETLRVRNESSPLHKSAREKALDRSSSCLLFPTSLSSTSHDGEEGCLTEREPAVMETLGDVQKLKVALRRVVHRFEQKPDSFSDDVVHELEKVFHIFKVSFGVQVVDDKVARAEDSLSPLGLMGSLQVEEQWERKEDPGSGQEYFFNTVTRETAWEQPVRRDEKDLGDSRGEIDLRTRIIRGGQKFRELRGQLDRVQQQNDREKSCLEKELAKQRKRNREIRKLRQELERLGKMEEIELGELRVKLAQTDTEAEQQDSHRQGETEDVLEAKSGRRRRRWTKYKDPDLDQPYFVNNETLESHWVLPDGVSESSIASASPEDDAELNQKEEGAEEPLSSNQELESKQEESHSARKEEGKRRRWTKYVDPEFEQPYFVNNDTSESHWVLPESVSMSSVMSALPQGPSLRDDENQKDKKRDEYVETIAEEEQAVVADEESQQQHQEGIEEDHGPTESCANSSGEQKDTTTEVIKKERVRKWTKYVDPDSKHPYFVNNDTSESHWVLPESVSMSSVMSFVPQGSAATEEKSQNQVQAIEEGDDEENEQAMDKAQAQGEPRQVEGEEEEDKESVSDILNDILAQNEVQEGNSAVWDDLVGVTDSEDKARDEKATDNGEQETTMEDIFQALDGSSMNEKTSLNELGGDMSKGSQRELDVDNELGGDMSKGSQRELDVDNELGGDMSKVSQRELDVDNMFDTLQQSLEMDDPFGEMPSEFPFGDIDLDAALEGDSLCGDNETSRLFAQDEIVSTPKNITLLERRGSKKDLKISVEEDSEEESSGGEAEKSSGAVPDDAEIWDILNARATPTGRQAGGWVERLDSASGDVFFVNLATGECRWDPPEEFERRAGIAKPKASQEAWELITTPEGSNLFFFNFATGWSLWDRPHLDNSCKEIPSTVLSSEKEHVSDLQLERLWGVLKESSKLMKTCTAWALLHAERCDVQFYFNESVNICQWNIPKEWDESLAKSVQHPGNNVPQATQEKHEDGHMTETKTDAKESSGVLSSVQAISTSKMFVKRLSERRLKRTWSCIISPRNKCLFEFNWDNGDVRKSLNVSAAQVNPVRRFLLQNTTYISDQVEVGGPKQVPGGTRHLWTVLQERSAATGLASVDWIEFFDEQSKETFYGSQDGKQWQWEAPSCILAQKAGEIEANEDGTEWKKIIGVEDTVYWYNEKTGETRYVDPTLPEQNLAVANTPAPRNPLRPSFTISENGEVLSPKGKKLFAFQ